MQSGNPAVADVLEPPLPARGLQAPPAASSGAEAPLPADAPVVVSPGEVTAVLDPGGVVVSISPNCSELLGFRPGELLGLQARELVHPDDAASLGPAIRAFSRGLTDHLHSIQRVRHKHFGHTLLESTLRSSAYAPGTRPAAAVIIVRRPPGAPGAIERPTVSLAPAAIGTAHAWVIRSSRRAVLASADPVFGLLLRTAAKRLVGRSLEQLTDPGDPAVGRARFATLLEGASTTYQVERSVGRGQAKVELTVSLLKLPDELGQMAVIHARDVTRQRQAEQAARNSLSELERSNRELEAFASVAAHDLSAPLRVVVGYAEMLSHQQSQLDPAFVDLLDKVTRTSRRLQAQVDGLMRLARTEPADLCTGNYDARGLLEEALESIGQEASSRGARVHIGPLPMVNCNAAGIVQVFQNLLGNGIKYGGDHPLVEIDALREEQGWRFSVRDRGIGLRGEELNRLFELFERGGSPARAPGAGIGLAVCKRIIDEHAGRIWCNPRPGGGTEFHFTLPDRD